MIYGFHETSQCLALEIKIEFCFAHVPYHGYQLTWYEQYLRVLIRNGSV